MLHWENDDLAVSLTNLLMQSLCIVGFVKKIIKTNCPDNTLTPGCLLSVGHTQACAALFKKTVSHWCRGISLFSSIRTNL